MKRLTQKEYDDLQAKIYEYPTKRKEGFLPDEIAEILKDFPDINMEKYYDAMMGNTCMMDNESGNLIIYHCDVFKAILCGLENRNLTVEEWD